MSQKRPLTESAFLRVIITLFVISVLGIFPIVYHDYYFDILAFKYHYYLVCAITFIVLSLAAVAVRFFLNGSTAPKERLKRWWFSFKAQPFLARLPFISLFVLLLVCTLSTLSSDYLYESFWGNEGRYTGLFLILIYGFVFLIICAFYRTKRWYLELFLAASLIVCMIGLIDFVGFDLLHFKDEISDQDKIIFTSTIGNINTYTAFISLGMGAAFLLFSIEESIARSLWYLICCLIFFLAIITGRSDNAYLALGVIFGFSPLYLFRRRSGIRRYFILLSLFATSFQIVDLVCNSTQANTPEMDGLFNVLVNFHGLAYIMIGLWILTAALYVIKHLTKEQTDFAGRKFQIAWLALVVIGFLVIVFALYDANAAGHAERYGAVGAYLQFNDSWGTNRGYAWRLAMKYYHQFPVLKKLLGYGPDTFGILTTDNDRDEMLRLYGVIYDNAHNEYLQFLVTIGLLGLLSYLVFLVSCGIRIIRRSSEHPWLMAFFFAVACYLGQAIVNLNVPITAPIMWLLLSLGVAGCRTKSGFSEVPDPSALSAASSHTSARSKKTA